MASGWLAATALVAFLVARSSNSTLSGSPLVGPAPPVSISQRGAVGLTTQTIQRVVSADGRVAADGASWALEAPAAPDDVAYRLLDAPIQVRALINGGPAGFNCPWLGLAQAPDGRATMRCRIPAEVRVAAGLTGTMALTLEKPKQALALPVTAVVGTEGQGQVVVVRPDGATVARSVTIGVSDIFWIEVTGGLEQSEQVLEFPTQMDFGASPR